MQISPATLVEKRTTEHINILGIFEGKKIIVFVFGKRTTIYLLKKVSITASFNFLPT